MLNLYFFVLSSLCTVVGFQRFSAGMYSTVFAAGMQNLVFWGPRSFKFDLEMNINIYCMHYIIREDYWRP